MDFYFSSSVCLCFVCIDLPELLVQHPVVKGLAGVTNSDVAMMDSCDSSAAVMDSADVEIFLGSAEMDLRMVKKGLAAGKDSDEAELEAEKSLVENDWNHARDQQHH